MDRVTPIGGRAATTLVPEGWVMDGQVAWRATPIPQADVLVRVSDPVGGQRVCTYPNVMYMWSPFLEGVSSTAPTCRGTPIRKPPASAVQCIRDVLIPGLFPGQSVRVTAETPLTGLTEEVRRMLSCPPPYHQRADAAVVRVEYDADGKTWEEDICCAIIIVATDGNTTQVWLMAAPTTMRAARGQLDRHYGLLQTLVFSVTPDRPWYETYAAMVRGSQVQRADEMSRLVVRGSAWDELKDTQRRLRAAWNAHTGATCLFHRPDGDEVWLPASVRAAWMSSRGEYLLSEQATCNPPADPAVTWTTLVPGPGAMTRSVKE